MKMLYSHDLAKQLLELPNGTVQVYIPGNPTTSIIKSVRPVYGVGGHTISGKGFEKVENPERKFHSIDLLF